MAWAYCTQYNLALEQLLDRLDTETRAVTSFKVRVRDNPDWYAAGAVVGNIYFAQSASSWVLIVSSRRSWRLGMAAHCPALRAAAALHAFAHRHGLKLINAE